MISSGRLVRPAFFAMYCALAIGDLGHATAKGTSEKTPPVALPPVLLQMIRDDAIQQELKLTESQKSQTLEALQAVDPRWWIARQMQPAPLALELESLTTELRSQLATFLDTDQQQRLAQLERQAVGTRMLLRDDVMTQLTITPEQQASLTAAFKETDSSTARVQGEVAKGQLDARQAQSKIDLIQTVERQQIVAVLSDVQKVGLVKLSGQPFDFSKVQRTYPLAPAIESPGATWIQGGPLNLDELRGKVVALHFYAFQCINCQRNFPHYQAWQADFADRGLVVIGIQRPETSAERDLKQVQAAVVRDGFKFPVLMDAASSNWNAWGNTMWPSVYLIDKHGFIRRWWQGEMNWEGGDGEKQMRETIEMLLKEE